MTTTVVPRYFLVVLEQEFNRFHSTKCYLLELEDGERLFTAMSHRTHLSVDDRLISRTKPEHRQVIDLLRRTKKYTLISNEPMDSCYWTNEQVTDTGVAGEDGMMELPHGYIIDRTLTVKLCQ